MIVYRYGNMFDTGIHFTHQKKKKRPLFVYMYNNTLVPHPHRYYFIRISGIINGYFVSVAHKRRYKTCNGFSG